MRKIEWVELAKPPPPKPKLEKTIDEEKKDAPKPPDMKKERPKLSLQALEASLEVGPGEFRSAFTIDQFARDGDLGGELVFGQNSGGHPLVAGRLVYLDGIKERIAVAPASADVNFAMRHPC